MRFFTHGFVGRVLAILLAVLIASMGCIPSPPLEPTSGAPEYQTLNLIPVPGGVLVMNAEGEVLGAAGVTGDTSENDATAAIAGIEAAGFSAQA